MFLSKSDTSKLSYTGKATNFHLFIYIKKNKNQAIKHAKQQTNNKREWMEAAIDICAVKLVFLNLLAKSLKNACEGFQLQPTDRIFTKKGRVFILRVFCVDFANLISTFL